MTISNLEKCVNFNDLVDSVKIFFICPVCKSKKELIFPRSIVDKQKNLTTISIPRNIVCEHPFQAFLDRNFKIRGYQKVDFEFGDKQNQTFLSTIDSKGTIESEHDFFKNLITEGNYVEYVPDKPNGVKKNINKVTQDNLFGNVTIKDEKIDNFESKINSFTQIENRSKNRNLREIYEDFWEFIDDNNENFQQFIINDKRRKKNYGEAPPSVMVQP